MPTFASIGLHPNLMDRIYTKSKVNVVTGVGIPNNTITTTTTTIIPQQQQQPLDHHHANHKDTIQTNPLQPVVVSLINNTRPNKSIFPIPVYQTETIYDENLIAVHSES